MWKRLVAALAAVVLAAVGVVLVLNYARGADQRALQGMETRDVLVAVEPVPAGTTAEAIGEHVETRSVPQNFVVADALEDLEAVEGEVLAVALAEGEQVSRQRFSTPAEIRASGQFELPEEAEDLHQVTVALSKQRALGGSVAAGDLVGVFMSFEVQGSEGYVLDDDGTISRQPTEDEDDGGDVSISTTHLTLHKVLVARVEGGVVEAPANAGDEEAESQQPEDTINVTLALEAPQAEQLVFAMEFGQVWLSLEPEDASEDGTGVVVVTIPNEARNAYQ